MFSFWLSKTLHKLAEDESLNYPKACETKKRGFYVNEVFTGGDTLQEVKQLQQDLITVLDKANPAIIKFSAKRQYQGIGATLEPSKGCIYI